MFITPSELNTVIYSYQLQEITEQDNDIVLQAISAAIEEVKSYLTNYDTDVIFTATGNDRNPLIMEYVKNIAVWQIIRLSNVDYIYTQAKDRYDRAIAWLKRVASGELFPNLPNLVDGNGNISTPFRFGSNPKFGHTY